MALDRYQDSQEIPLAFCRIVISGLLPENLRESVTVAHSCFPVISGFFHSAPMSKGTGCPFHVFLENSSLQMLLLVLGRPEHLHGAPGADGLAGSMRSTVHPKKTHQPSKTAFSSSLMQFWSLSVPLHSLCP